MSFEHVSIRNVLSFGPKVQTLYDFRAFNLFIGRNGAGKTNALRILGDLKTDLSVVGGAPIPIQTGEYTRSRQLWLAELDRGFENDRVTQGGSNIGDLCIAYVSSREPAGRKQVVFEHGEHVSGDFTEFKRWSTYIAKPLSEFELGKRLELLEDGWQLALLNFGLRTIFDLEVGVSHGGMLVEFFTKCSDTGELKGGGGGVVRFNSERWPSGFLQVTSMLLQFLSASTVVLIDEPEQSLEPIRCRHLMRFLVWLTMFGEADESLPQYAQSFVKDYSEKWGEWSSNPDRRKHYKLEDHDFRGVSAKQVFVSSHAPQLIQEFLTLDDAASIYEFKLEWQDNNFDPSNGGLIRGGCSYTNDQKAAGLARQQTLFTSVRRVKSGFTSILDNIGAKGSDLLQCNGVIWVEGPSDVVYLSKWIELYTRERSIAAPRKGLDFQFQMYGGALLDSICITTENLTEEEQAKKLVDMFSFSRNAFVVIDSDSLIRDGKVIDNSNFQTAKKFISRQFSELRSAGTNIALWYDEGNVDAYSIEDHLDDASIEQVGERKSQSKVKYAQKVVDSWSKEKKLSEFKVDLESKIQHLVESVLAWNV